MYSVSGWSLKLPHLKGACLLIAQSLAFSNRRACRFQLRCGVESSKDFPAIYQVVIALLLVHGAKFTHEERPRRLGVVPSVRRSRVGIEGRGVDRATLGDEVLLDEAGALVAAHFPVEDLHHALVGVLPYIHTGSRRRCRL